MDAQRNHRPKCWPNAWSMRLTTAERKAYEGAGQECRAKPIGVDQGTALKSRPSRVQAGLAENGGIEPNGAQPYPIGAYKTPAPPRRGPLSKRRFAENGPVLKDQIIAMMVRVESRGTDFL